MNDAEVAGALAVATGEQSSNRLTEIMRRLDDAGYRVVPLACDRCGRFLSLSCSVHGDVES